MIFAKGLFWFIKPAMWVIAVVIIPPVAFFIALPDWAQALIGIVVLCLILRSRRRLSTDAPFLDWDRMDPLAFERACLTMMRSQNWRARTTKESGDQGVDVLADKRGVRVVIQCKRYSRPVGNTAVQEALAGKAFVGATAAAVVSNAGYTPAARELAGRTGVLLLHPADLARADRLFMVPPGPAKVVRSCRSCGIGLRLPVGRSGVVPCPSCRARNAIST